MSKAQSVAAKIRHKFLLPPETKERLNYARTTAVNGLQLILGLFSGPVGLVSVPVLKGGIEGLLFVIDVIQVQILLALPLRPLMNTENLSKRGRPRAIGESDQ